MASPALHQARKLAARHGAGKAKKKGASPPPPASPSLNFTAMWSFHDSVQALAAHGISCFDVDVSQTKDGFLLVGHPGMLQAFLAQNNVSESVENSTLGALHVACGGAEHLEALFPRLGDVLQVFADLPHASEKEGPLAEGGPMLFVELKGQAFSMHNLQYMAQQLELLGLTNTVNVWFPPGKAGDVQMLHDVKWQHKLKLRAGRAYLDSAPGPTPDSPRVPIQSEMKEEDRKFDFLGPSIKAQPEQLFKDVLASHLPIVLWNIDTPQDLDISLQLGAMAIISNVPLRMLAELSKRSASVCA